MLWTPITLVISALTQATPALADATIINTIKETADSKSGVKTVTEIQQLSDGSIRQIQTQSNGYVIDDTYYSDGSGIGKMYQDGKVFYTDEYEPGEKSATYKTLKERLEPEKTIVSNTSKSTGSTTKTGWIKEGDKWTYRYSSGEKCYGWLKDGDSWYYLNRNGNMQQDGMFEIDGKIYSFDSDGRLQENSTISENEKKTGWVKDGIVSPTGQGWKYVYSTGENCVGWLQDKGYWYYFDKCGHMVKNEMRKIEGKVYSFDTSGHMEVNISRKNIYSENTFNHTGPNEYCPFVTATTTYNIEIDAHGVGKLTDSYYDQINADVNNILCKKEEHYLNDGSRHVIAFDKHGDQVFGWYLESTWDINSRSYVKKWTYYDENGLEVRGTSKLIDGKTYSFDSNGYII